MSFSRRSDIGDNDMERVVRPARGGLTIHAGELPLESSETRLALVLLLALIASAALELEPDRLRLRPVLFGLRPGAQVIDLGHLSFGLQSFHALELLAREPRCGLGRVELGARLTERRLSFLPGVREGPFLRCDFIAQRLDLRPHPRQTHPLLLELQTFRPGLQLDEDISRSHGAIERQAARNHHAVGRCREGMEGAIDLEPRRARDFIDRDGGGEEPGRPGAEDRQNDGGPDRGAPITIGSERSEGARERAGHGGPLRCDHERTVRSVVSHPSGRDAGSSSGRPPPWDGPDRRSHRESGEPARKLAGPPRRRPAP